MRHNISRPAESLEGMTIVTKSSPVGDDQKSPPQTVNPDEQGSVAPDSTSPVQDPPTNPSSSEIQPSEPERVATQCVDADDGQEPDFPHDEMARLDEMINRPRWVVPVLHNGELEILLDAVIELCKNGKVIFLTLCLIHKMR